MGFEFANIISTMLFLIPGYIIGIGFKKSFRFADTLTAEKQVTAKETARAEIILTDIAIFTFTLHRESTRRITAGRTHQLDKMNSFEKTEERSGIAPPTSIEIPTKT